MKNERLLYGRKENEPEWMEVILSSNPANFEKIKAMAKRDGFVHFREFTIDLSKLRCALEDLRASIGEAEASKVS